MKRSLLSVALLALGLFDAAPARAQTFAGNDQSAAQLEALTKKIDEQTLKIDALSQQILKLEKQIENIRPGVMIGEQPTATPAAAPAATPAAAGSENTHTVAKGETLTSIAKQHRVGVQELQKFNRIENDRALQIGQTILIPPTAGASPAPTPSPSE